MDNNNKSEVFISYAWGEGSSKDEDRNQFISDLCAVSERNGVKILIDREEVTYKKSIKEFMNKLGRGKFVIIVVSDKYLKSKYCMYEALQILKDDDYYDRIFPVIFRDAKIYDPIEILEYIKYWTDKINELNKKLIETDALVYSKPLIDELELYFDIRRLLTRFTTILSDLNTLTPEKLRENDFSILFGVINNEAANYPSRGGLRYCVDLAFCVDTSMTESSLNLLKDFWLRENIKLLRDKFRAKSKEVTTLRGKILEINNPNGINTRFYDLDKDQDTAQFYGKVTRLIKSDVAITNLSMIKKAIQSDWIHLADKARHVILIFSESSIVNADIAELDELTNIWDESDYMTYNAKRLIMYAPDGSPWNEISSNWMFTIHYPTEIIDSRVIHNHTDIDTIMDNIVMSI